MEGYCCVVSVFRVIVKTECLFFSTTVGLYRRWFCKNHFILIDYCNIGSRIVIGMVGSDDYITRMLFASRVSNIDIK